MCFFFFNRITDFPPPLQGLELSRCRLWLGVTDCSVELGRSKVDKVVDKVVDEEVKSKVEPKLRQSWELEGEEEGDWRGVDPEQRHQDIGHHDHHLHQSHQHHQPLSCTHLKYQNGTRRQGYAYSDSGSASSSSGPAVSPYFLHF